MKYKLTVIAVKKAADGKLQDGGGLILVKSGETGKWVYRYSHLGKRREMGLGQWPTVTLADARRVRDGWAAELAAGRDPISVRDGRKAAEVDNRDRIDPSFQDLTMTVFEARQAALRGGGERGRWLSPLNTHIFPKFGRRAASTITRHDIADALRPIWKKHHPTASKAIERIGIVLREGRLMGFAVDPFEADAAKRILGDVHHVATPIASTPWQDIPALYARLGDGPLANCLRLMILTAMRTDPCAGARIEEFDGDIWTIPADRMKGTERSARAFRVPLSDEAQRLVKEMSEFSTDILFASYKGNPPSSKGLEKRLNTLKEKGRPHGFRTSFRTWCQDHDIAWDVAETSLGHTIGGKVERTYARSDLLDRRRPVMQAWADYVTGRNHCASNNVMSFESGVVHSG